MTTWNAGHQRSLSVCDVSGVKCVLTIVRVRLRLSLRDVAIPFFAGNGTGIGNIATMTTTKIRSESGPAQNHDISIDVMISLFMQSELELEPSISEIMMNI